MTPLFACMPVCLTFVAIGIIGIVVVMAVGTNQDGPNAPVDGLPAVDAPYQGASAPPLWLIALIFAVVLIHFAILLWLWPEL